MAGLSAAEISVVRGFARRSAPRLWLAELTIEPRGLVLPLALDFVALASARAVEGGPVVLFDYAISRSPSGALLLQVTGADRVGFLSSLLHALAGLTLFPEEMSVETRDGLAQDGLLLRGIGGGAPSAGAHQALELLLKRGREAPPNPVGAPNAALPGERAGQTRQRSTIVVP